MFVLHQGKSAFPFKPLDKQSFRLHIGLTSDRMLVRDLILYVSYVCMIFRCCLLWKVVFFVHISDCESRCTCYMDSAFCLQERYLPFIVNNFFLYNISSTNTKTILYFLDEIEESCICNLQFVEYMQRYERSGTKEQTTKFNFYFNEFCMFLREIHDFL